MWIHRNQELGGSKPDPPNFFILCMQWGLAAFQWGSNPPPIFTLLREPVRLKQTLWWSRRVGWSGLDMLNVKMII